ncbi:hypothetical protein C5167_041506 [Papaver somniferum]|nr:hypothetical protein C5167_041506 [Papaver somniferum]
MVQFESEFLVTGLSAYKGNFSVLYTMQNQHKGEQGKLGLGIDGWEEI